MKVEFSQQIFEKHSNIKFHENLSSGSRVVRPGRADGRTDKEELIAALRLKHRSDENVNIPPIENMIHGK